MLYRFSVILYCLSSLLYSSVEHCQGESYQGTSTEKNDHVYSEDINKFYNLDLYNSGRFFSVFAHIIAIYFKKSNISPSCDTKASLIFRVKP